MKKYSRQMLLLLLLSFYSIFSYAWNHSIEIGYGYSHDPNHSRYNNSGVLINGDIAPLWVTSYWRWSIFGSVGRFWTTTPVHKNLTTAALNLSLRVYPFYLPECNPFYLFLASGPSIMSTRQYGYNHQAKNVAFQSAMGFGAEIKNIDINLRWQHYSNANLAKPNEGYNVLYLLSIGYLF